MSAQKNTNQTVIDPVCGMAVVPSMTDIATTMKGKTYHFCAEGCRKAFEDNPQKFIDPQPGKKKGWWGRYLARLEKSTGGKGIKCH